MPTNTPIGPLPQEIWDNDVASLPETSANWVWPGFVSRGNLTLFTSMWKAGKTTLLAHLLARRVTGQPLLDRPVSPGKTVVLSEEPRTMWADRCRQFAFGGRLCLFPQPFAHLPGAEEWRRLLARVGQLQAEHGIDLLVIDSVTHFLRAESSAQGVLDLLLPVRELTNLGMAGLLLHHPRRAGSSAGNAGRGHGALHAEVDISIEMRHAGRDLDGRARRFFSLSRHADTPRHLHFELNEAGSDYVVLSAAEPEASDEQWDILRSVLEEAPQKLTRSDILDGWPTDHPKPPLSTLWRWLQSATRSALIHVEGTGRKNDPHRYWLPSTAARWREDPLHEFLERQEREMGLPFVSLGEKKRREAMVGKDVEA